jgi:hypothetical protein
VFTTQLLLILGAMIALATTFSALRPLRPSNPYHV